MHKYGNRCIAVYLYDHSGCSFTTPTAWPFDHHITSAVLLILQFALGSELLQVNNDPKGKAV